MIYSGVIGHQKQVLVGWKWMW